MEALIALFFILFFGFVILCWYLIAKAAVKVVGGVIDVAESALQNRQRESDNGPGSQQTLRESNNGPGSQQTSRQVIHDGTSVFTQLRSRQAKPGIVPGTQSWIDLAYVTIPLQSATKAAYYYSRGHYSGVSLLLENVTVEECRDESLHRLLMRLKAAAAGKVDRPGAGQERALTAGDPSQGPHSAVLWAIENGHYDQLVIEGIKRLVQKQLDG